MPQRALTAAQQVSKAQREVEDLHLVLRSRNGDDGALDALIRRYTGFVRLKASSYFIAGGESEDLIQEGLIGLYKAVRDFRSDKDTSFRSFAELCITRQIITAIKTATRYKHAPLRHVRLLQPDSRRPGRLGRHPRGRAGRADRRRPGRLCDLDRRAAEPRFHARHRPVATRIGRAAPLPRGPVLRADGRGAGVRHEDDRQRAAAGQAEGARCTRAPAVSCSDRDRRRASNLILQHAGVAQLARASAL